MIPVRCDGISGKSEAHNYAVEYTTGDILVFIDADTLFMPDFLENIVGPFLDSAVGTVDGHLLFQ